eukprot:TRINITY_DN3385_c0_g1_i1.p1 TRINITY_DN3385_c0_g1~~TRINITY_DN3385_c0_g1_i1.p1  ORF type:complete len:381 (-),score=64.72 TRINITY_DN3385_c0_g1_i1:323-1465(-)
MDDPFILGWGSVALSCLCFGSFAVPIKMKAVANAKVDPLVFQTYKTVWFFITSFFLLAYNDFVFSPLGILNGALWVPAGCFSFTAVKILGIGVAQGAWSGIIIGISFFWGIVFDEKVKSIPLAVLAIVLLTLGVMGMASCTVLTEALTDIRARALQLEEQRDKRSSHFLEEVKSLVSDDGLAMSEKTPLLHTRGQEIVSSEEKKGNQESSEEKYMKIWKFSVRKELVGVFCAIATGVLGGSGNAPLKYAIWKGEPAGGIIYLISFSIGSMMVNIVMYIVYAIVLYFVYKEPIPTFQLKILFIPGSLSGLLWTGGNFFATYAVIFLGIGIGYPSVQASLIISGLWGILYYRELKGFWSISLWFVSAFLTLGTVVFLSQLKA